MRKSIENTTTIAGKFQSHILYEITRFVIEIRRARLISFSGYFLRCIRTFEESVYMRVKLPKSIATYFCVFQLN